MDTEQVVGLNKIIRATLTRALPYETQETIDDLQQDAWVKILEADKPELASLIASGIARDHRRKVDCRTEPETVEKAVAWALKEELADSPEDKFIIEEMFDEVISVYRALPTTAQTIVYAHLVLGLSLLAVSKNIEKSPAAVYARYNSFRDDVKKVIYG